MAWISSTLVFLVLGIGTLFVAWRGHTSDEFVVVRYFRPYRANRFGNPIRFYFQLSILIAAGALWIVWGTFIFVGLLKPLPWH